MTAAEGVRAVVHEAMTSLGSIRMAVTAVVEGAVDEDTAGVLLANAALETQRLNSLLLGIAPLVEAQADGSPPEALDVDGVLGEAVRLAAARAVAVRTERLGGELVLGHRGSLAGVLAALFVLASDGHGDVVVTRATANRAAQCVLVIRRADGESARPERATIRQLIEAVGANVAHLDDGQIGVALPAGG